MDKKKHNKWGENGLIWIVKVKQKKKKKKNLNS